MSNIVYILAFELPLKFHSTHTASKTPIWDLIVSVSFERRTVSSNAILGLSNKPATKLKHLNL